MLLKLTRASTMEESEREISTLEDLLSVVAELGELVIHSAKDGVISATIYDDYIE